MNIQQLQYVVSIDEHRHFQKAAEACFVTPATLSIMMKKLEDELGTVIFDRTKQPVLPTEMGKVVIKNAREILGGVKKMEHEVRQKENGNELEGELRIGVIPTLAPYLIHLFMSELMEKFPLLNIQLKEISTEQILNELSKDTIDVGLFSIQNNLSAEYKTRLLFNEKLMVFVSDKEKKLKSNYLLPKDIDLERLWLLDEEHCLRNDVLNLCALKKKNKETEQLKFEAGSIETLMNLVEMTKGITIIPELATMNMSKKRKSQIRSFASPEPARPIGMVTYRHFIKEKLLDALEDEIKRIIPKYLNDE